VSDAEFVFLRGIFALEPLISWQEASDELFAVGHVLRTPRQIRVACYSRGYTKKARQTSATARDEGLRRAFVGVLQAGAFQANQFVVIDETHKRGHDIMRDKGLAPRGQRVVAKSYGAMLGQRYSCLTAIDYSSVVTCQAVDVKDHNIDAATHQAWLEACVLPHMNRFPAPRSVLLLDNARVHDRVRITTKCASIGVIVLWLPAYSCDFSPIELVFNNAKRVLKERFGRNTNYGGMSLGQMFVTCIFSALTPEQMCDTFAHCLFPVTIAERNAVY
jgi:hypothetical protein